MGSRMMKRVERPLRWEAGSAVPVTGRRIAVNDHGEAGRAVTTATASHAAREGRP